MRTVLIGVSNVLNNSQPSIVPKITHASHHRVYAVFSADIEDAIFWYQHIGPNRLQIGIFVSVENGAEAIITALKLNKHEDLVIIFIEGASVRAGVKGRKCSISLTRLVSGMSWIVRGPGSILLMPAPPRTCLSRSLP